MQVPPQVSCQCHFKIVQFLLFLLTSEWGLGPKLIFMTLSCAVNILGGVWRAVGVEWGVFIAFMTVMCYHPWAYTTVHVVHQCVLFFDATCIADDNDCNDVGDDDYDAGDAGTDDGDDGDDDSQATTNFSQEVAPWSNLTL